MRDFPKKLPIRSLVMVMYQHLSSFQGGSKVGEVDLEWHKEMVSTIITLKKSVSFVILNFFEDFQTG